MHKYITLLIFLSGKTPLILGMGHHARSLSTDSAQKTAAADNIVHSARLSDFKECKSKATPEEDTVIICNQAEAKEASTKAEQEKITLANIIHLPKELGQDETIDLAQRDPISQTSFEILIKESHDRDESFLLARVLTQDIKTGRFNRSYYEAHGLNIALFGNYPITVTHNHRALYNFSAARTEHGDHLNKSYQNPLDQLSITNGIHYFSTHPKIPSAGFTYFCSHQQLLAEEQSEIHFLQKFYVNQQENLTLKEKALEKLLNLSVAYHSAKKYHTAAQCLEPVAQQTTHPKAQYEALERLGSIYFQGGNGIQRDFAQAVKYLEPVAQQSASKDEQIRALAYLGRIHYTGDDTLQKNFAKAIIYLKPIIQQSDIPLAQAEGYKLLGRIYFEGGYGVTRDLPSAIKYLEHAAQQSLHHGARGEAHSLLEKIKCELFTQAMSEAR